MQFNDTLNDIKVYEAGKPIELVVREFGIKPQDVIKLASNENPKGPSPKVIEAIKNNAHNVFLYPDDSMFELKDALSSKFGINNNNIIIGAGSDQVISFCVSAKANSKKGILTAGVTFAMYEIYAKQVGAKVFKTKTSEHNLDELEEIYKKHKDEISIIFLCLPNNPLGECLDKKDVYNFIKKVDENVLIVVDGAYQEFASFKDEAKKVDPKDLIQNFSNVIYLGTFSKAYALGGLRCGYGISNENIIQALYKLRPPFNITNLSLFAAISALRDEEYVNECIKDNFKEMKEYENFAKKLDIEYIPSYTNFITFKFKDNINSTEISDELFKKGIIVRNLKSYGMNAIRITIGLKEQNLKLFKAFEELYKTMGN